MTLPSIAHTYRTVTNFEDVTLLFFLRFHFWLGLLWCCFLCYEKQKICDTFHWLGTFKTVKKDRNFREMTKTHLPCTYTLIYRKTNILPSFNADLPSIFYAAIFIIATTQFRDNKSSINKTKLKIHLYLFFLHHSKSINANKNTFAFAIKI